MNEDIKMFYVITSGQFKGIYLSKEQWVGNSKEIKKKKHKMKFELLIEAEEYYARFNNGKLPKNKEYKEYAKQKEVENQKRHKNVRNCVFCGKPFKKPSGKGGNQRQGVVCKSCKNKAKQMNTIIRGNKSYGINKRINSNHLLYIKDKYKCKDVISFVLENPSIVNDAFINSTGQEMDNIQKSTFESYKNPEFKKDDSMPLYIEQLLGADKEIISIKGDKRNPIIRFRCKRCDNCFSLSFNELKKHKGHDCSGLLSSGEAIVKDYLKKSGIKFLTQRDTLPCTNPETGRVMPYDFEIPDKKIIIEVQGEQHRVFIERFHINEEGFEYQKKKDLFKKKYAEEKGYQVIELWYDEISSGKYKDILNNLLNINKVTI